MITFDRRRLLVAGGAGIGLIVAFAMWPRDPSSPLAAGKNEELFGPYLKIDRDGLVTVAIPQAEAGQGTWTGLAQVAADALGADWERVAVEPAPAAPDYANALLGARVTAGSTSMRAFEAPLREAGEAARGLLVRAAAERWDVDATECSVGGGTIRHGGRTIGFGEVAEKAATLRPAGPRGTRNTRLVGRPLSRLELPAKASGRLRFAGDVRLSGLLFAAARLAPAGGQLSGFDRAAGLGQPGASELVADSGWLAAIGETWWAAEKALQAAEPRFSGRAGADSALDRALETAMRSGRADRLVERGDFDSAVGQARALGATYRIAPAPHDGLEPLTATARFSGGRLEVWAPVQAYDLARASAASAGAVPAESVVLYPTPVGDSAGRAIEADAIPIAVVLAKRLGRPVQLTVSATGSRNHDRPRPPLVARMAAMPSPQGSIAAWSARFVTAPGFEAALARMRGEEAAALDLEGAAPPYAIPSLRIDAVRADLPIACGYMRGGSAALTGFANECFVDEMARSLGREPLAFRMAMLGGNARLARVLVAATNAAAWDGGGAGSRMGLACASAFGSHIALVAVAGIGSDQRIAVEKLFAAVDCGLAINPGLIRQQIEGGLLHALSLATAKAPSFLAGMPVARGFRASGFARALDVPQITVEIIGRDDAVGGVSGLAHTVLAPALANALAAATGRRLRNLPFDLMAG